MHALFQSSIKWGENAIEMNERIAIKWFNNGKKREKVLMEMKWKWNLEMNSVKKSSSGAERIRHWIWIAFDASESVVTSQHETDDVSARLITINLIKVMSNCAQLIFNGSDNSDTILRLTLCWPHSKRSFCYYLNKESHFWLWAILSQPSHTMWAYKLNKFQYFFLQLLHYSDNLSFFLHETASNNIE